MIKQRSVHLKLDTLTYERLEQEIFVSGINRNRLINIAVNTYIRLADTKRRYGMYGRQEEYIDHARALNIW